MEQIKLKNMIIVKVDNGRQAWRMKMEDARWAWQSITNKKVIKAFVISRKRYENKKIY